jgi:uncharacterized membrane protein
MIDRRYPAQALGFVVVALPMFVAIAGLAIDTTVLTLERRELQSAVDGAARAGATRVDTELLRASGGSDVQLDVNRARAAGHAYLEQTLTAAVAWRSQPRWQVDVTRTQVHVSVAGTLHTVFLRVVGIDQVPVGATSDASVEFGVRAPAP